MNIASVCALDRFGRPDLADVRWVAVDERSVKVVQVVLVTDLLDPDHPHHTPLINFIDRAGRLWHSPGPCSLWYPDAEAAATLLASRFGLTLGRHYVRAEDLPCWR